MLKLSTGRDDYDHCQLRVGSIRRRPPPLLLALEIIYNFEKLRRDCIRVAGSAAGCGGAGYGLGALLPKPPTRQPFNSEEPCQPIVRARRAHSGPFQPIICSFERQLHLLIRASVRQFVCQTQTNRIPYQLRLAIDTPLAGWLAS